MTNCAWRSFFYCWDKFEPFNKYWASQGICEKGGNDIGWPDSFWNLLYICVTYVKYIVTEWAGRDFEGGKISISTFSLKMNFMCMPLMFYAICCLSICIRKDFSQNKNVFFRILDIPEHSLIIVYSRLMKDSRSLEQQSWSKLVHNWINIRGVLIEEYGNEIINIY